MPKLPALVPAAILGAVAAAAPAPVAAPTPPYPGLDTQGEARLFLGDHFSLALERNGDMVVLNDQDGGVKYRVPALSGGGSDLPCYRYQSTMTADGVILLIGYYKGTFTNADGVPVTREGVKVLGDFLGRPGGALVIAGNAETGHLGLMLRSPDGELPLALERLTPVQAAQPLQAPEPAPAPASAEAGATAPAAPAPAPAAQPAQAAPPPAQAAQPAQAMASPAPAAPPPAQAAR